MKALVAVKRVLDPYVRARARADGTGVELENAKMAMNPFCENALEQALRWREKGFVAEVAAASVGPPPFAETLRHALALGADRAVRVAVDFPPEPLGVAKALAALARKEEAEVILMGKQAIDGDFNQTGQMTAALLGWAQATFLSKAEPGNGVVLCEREVDDGILEVEVKTPCVLTADLRLNEPRYATLPNIMKAKRKPIEELTPEELAADLRPRLEVLKVEEPPARKAGVKVANVAELLDKLKNEAKAL